MLRMRLNQNLPIHSSQSHIYTIGLEKSDNLSCYVETQCHNMGVQHGGVEGRDKQI